MQVAINIKYQFDITCVEERSFISKAGNTKMNQIKYSM